MSMSEAERTRLKQLGTAQAKVAKAEAIRVAAENKARFEGDLKRKFSWLEREEWKAPMEAAEAAVEPLAARVDAECESLGIPKAFRPRLYAGWHRGGFDLAKHEIEELRRLAHVHIDAQLKAAFAAIETRLQTYTVAVLSDGLSEHARALLDKLPDVQSLLAPMDFENARGFFVEELSRQMSLPYYERDRAYREIHSDVQQDLLSG